MLRDRVFFWGGEELGFEMLGRVGWKGFRGLGVKCGESCVVGTR
jgi:hypothetical protein